jgi:hypothetical protein
MKVVVELSGVIKILSVIPKMKYPEGRMDIT